MNYISGKIKKTIFYNEDSGFLVGLFRIKETNDKNVLDKVNKTITITGVFPSVNLDVAIKIYGEYIRNDRFGMQYKANNYVIELPSTKESIIDFLSSSFISGCGEVTAKKIVDFYGENAIEIIKNDKNKLFAIEGLTEARATKIYTSLCDYSKSSDIIKNLQDLGFTVEECFKIYQRFKNNIEDIFADDFYELNEIIDFAKLDSIYVNKFGSKTKVRINACLLEAMRQLSNTNGDTYYFDAEILEMLRKKFNIELNEEVFEEFISGLIAREKIVKLEDRYYLKSYYDKEKNIAKNLYKIDNHQIKKIPNIFEKLAEFEKSIGILYNEDQQKAISSALNNNVTIISGGPGTGKTTIINAIVKLFIKENKWANKDIAENIALLAPTGRAAKKLSTSTNLPAYTIHRYLKWYKDSNDFFYNEFNKTRHRLIIVDEVSMIDTDLFNALLNGISSNVKLIFVGDTFQLPSVGAGLILNDLIASDYFTFIPLNKIYRQSENSYIPYLAKEIKNKELSEDFTIKKDDYNFIRVPNNQIKNGIEKIIRISLEKNIDEKNMQILAPMYRGENGIDNLNYILQNIYNPKSSKKEEVTYGDVVYRENDKVLQLINDLDNNVFNGDIGFITKIVNNKIYIDFDEASVIYEKKDLKNIKHAYAITIHKSQGSEFEHVIMPITSNYYKMLYNKLVYTGVSRAKKSLTIIGNLEAFKSAIYNDYSSSRKTSLKEAIIDVYNENN